MKQRNKIISVTVLSSLVFVMILMISLVGVFRGPFTALETSIAEQNFRYTLDMLHNELNHLDRFIVDWAAWDATAQFITDKNPEYIEENLQNNTFLNQNLNIFCVVDTKGQVVYTKCIKFSGDDIQPVNLAMFSKEAMLNNRTLWEHADVESNIAGFCPTESGVLMLASRPVTNNSNTGPVRGTLIMGRFITDRYLATITKQMCLGFDWWNLQKEYTRTVMNNYLARITDQNKTLLEFKNNDTIEAYVILPDIEGRPAILFKSILSNNIAPYKNNFLAKGAIVFFLESILFFLVLSILLPHYCMTKTDYEDSEPSHKDIPDTQNAAIAPSPLDVV